MENRHSSPSSGATSPRPMPQRQRSNSFPLVEALGCSTPEARLVLAEGRAAVQRRYANQRRRRNLAEESEKVTTFRPRDHWDHLNHQSSTESDVGNIGFAYSKRPHSRTPSDSTDRSTSTVTLTGPSTASASGTGPTSPIWDYSANLAKFVQTQLNSISSYNPMAYLRACPEAAPPPKLSTGPQSPQVSQLPTRTERQRSLETPGVIEMPPVRPPLRSAFSAWSSTEEGTEDEVSPHHGDALQRKASRASNHTPSTILRYYENGSASSFLLTSTPLEEIEERRLASATSNPLANYDAFNSRSAASIDANTPFSTLSTQPQLCSSSAPSLSSISTASYFECKRGKPRQTYIANGLLAAASPDPVKSKYITAISPFEGEHLTTVHDIRIEGQTRVHVDGHSFDLVRTFNA
ncbi:hypothetical protein M011DRAFT_495369 [Sporormia fimetaria CBS 119925]|uniref:Uncharacterized protein n=1 Tax=Sporormia fimetaria CBS 119925 TaxID=1340428 RepID=A0A6A6V5X2_9PLEO|nr:hypothetical protein M011DRAFT_495369 [Sporormia fimetaria CBS 119925]